MSDVNSSLPVRTEAAGDIAAKIVDGTITSQALSIDSSGKVTAKINDGAGNALASSSSAPAGTEQALIVRNIPSGTQVVSGTVDVSNLPTTVDTNYGAVGASTLRTAAEIGNSSGAADFNNGATGAQTLRVAANLALLGSDVTGTNPIPVSIVDTVAGSTEVLDFKQASAIAASASDTHTYTVTAGKTLALQKIAASGSGKIKVEIKLNNILKVVLFNSTSNPNVEYQFGSPQQVAAGINVDVVITNLDKAAQDLYSTIEGYEV